MIMSSSSGLTSFEVRLFNWLAGKVEGTTVNIGGEELLLESGTKASSFFIVCVLALTSFS
jgi:hypothetical protein